MTLLWSLGMYFISDSKKLKHTSANTIVFYSINLLLLDVYNAQKLLAATIIPEKEVSVAIILMVSVELLTASTQMDSPGPQLIVTVMEAVPLPNPPPL